MTHRVRLAALTIDCRIDDLTAAAAFRAGALGGEAEIKPDGRCAVFGAGRPRVLRQAVEHEPRVHLDFQTDDREAEAARLTALGAREPTRVEGWIVMEAPTGHRFRLDPPGTDFPADAREVEGWRTAAGWPGSASIARPTISTRRRRSGRPCSARRCSRARGDT